MKKLEYRSLDTIAICVLLSMTILAVSVVTQIEGGPNGEVTVSPIATVIISCASSTTAVSMIWFVLTVLFGSSHSEGTIGCWRGQQNTQLSPWRFSKAGTYLTFGNYDFKGAIIKNHVIEAEYHLSVPETSDGKKRVLRKTFEISFEMTDNDIANFVEKYGTEHITRQGFIDFAKLSNGKFIPERIISETMYGRTQLYYEDGDNVVASVFENADLAISEAISTELCELGVIGQKTKVDVTSTLYETISLA